MNSGLQKWNFFSVKEFFFVNFDFKNGCKNDFEDNIKIDFRADWPHESNPTAWELNFYFSAYVVGCCQGGQLSLSELKKSRIDFNEEKTFFQKKFIRIWTLLKYNKTCSYEKPLYLIFKISWILRKFRSYVDSYQPIRYRCWALQLPNSKRI